MASRRTPVYTSCLESLRRIAAEAAAEGGQGSLPTVRDLAREAGTSVFTVSRALRELAREGVVVVVRGRGAYTPAQAARRKAAQVESMSRPPSPPKWQTVRARIEHDTLTGVFPPDLPLPAARDLAHRYGVSAPTVRRALGAQSSSGEGPKPLAAIRVLPRTHSTLLLVTEADTAGQPVFVNQRNHDFFWQLEREGARRGLSLYLQPIPAHCLGAQHVQHVCTIVNRAIAARTTAAVVLVAAGFEQPQGVVSRLSAEDLPLAVLDERQRVSPPQNGARRSPVCVVAMESSTAPGMKVGLLLRTLGHTRVAFFTDAPEGAWSAQRLQGIGEALGGTAVTSYGQAPQAAAPLTAQVEHAIAAVPQGLRSRFALHQTSFIAAETTRAAVVPLFERALRERAATAWVAVHDPVALLAMEFLHSRSVRVPRDIAVVGFDNYLEAQQGDLTSYDFGFERAVHAIVNFACNPRAPLFRRSDGRVAIEGSVVRRGSTG